MFPKNAKISSHEINRTLSYRQHKFSRIKLSESAISFKKCWNYFPHCTKTRIWSKLDVTDSSRFWRVSISIIRIIKYLHFSSILKFSSLRSCEWQLRFINWLSTWRNMHKWYLYLPRWLFRDSVAKQVVLYSCWTIK